MIKTVFLMFLLFSIFATPAHSNDYYPDSFQKALKDGQLANKNLKEELFKILSYFHLKQKSGPDLIDKKCVGDCYVHTQNNYKVAKRHLFTSLHLKKDQEGYYIKDAYCERRYDHSNADVGPNSVPNENIINCEHTWPQSRFTGNFNDGLQKGDLHHLFPTNSKQNNLRASYFFAEVSGDEKTTENCATSKLGDIATYSSIGDANIQREYFEPPTNHKGNVARAIFYFSTRYKLPISQEEEHYLKLWHKEDPVDQEEQTRNDQIMKIQGNRNPFIDMPELVDLISDF